MKVVKFLGIFLLMAICAVGYHEAMSSAVISKVDSQIEENSNQSNVIADLQLQLEEKNRTIKELENSLALARKKQKLEAKPAEVVAKLETEKKEQPSPTSRWKKHMDDFKKRDPEGYEKMMQKREERRNRMAEGFQKRSEYFATLDVTNASEKQIANHEKLQEKMTKVNELMDKMYDEELSDQERGEMRRDMFREMRDMNKFMESERELILGNLAQDIGYESDEAQQFVDYIGAVLDMTSVHSMFMGRGGKRK